MVERSSRGIDSSEANKLRAKHEHSGPKGAPLLLVSSSGDESVALAKDKSQQVRLRTILHVRE